MESYRCLKISDFDTQLSGLIQRAVKEVPAGTAKEVSTWYDRNDDHGITYKYYRNCPIESLYIPPHSNRL